MHLTFRYEKSCVAPAEEIGSTVFALFALYALYNTQPLQQRVKVNVNVGKSPSDFVELWNSLVEVYKCVQDNAMENDYLHIMKLMRNNNCFSFGVIVGLKTILLDTHGYILKK